MLLHCLAPHLMAGAHLIAILPSVARGTEPRQFVENSVDVQAHFYGRSSRKRKLSSFDRIQKKRDVHQKQQLLLLL